MNSFEIDFARIVREHKGTIYTVCYMFSKDEEEVADLFQDILVNLWKGYAKFRGDSSVRTWIYRVSLNTCISADRKKKKKGETVPLDMNINLFDDSVEDMKQIRMLQSRISRLGPFDRTIYSYGLKTSAMMRSVPLSESQPRTFPYVFSGSRSS